MIRRLLLLSLVALLVMPALTDVSVAQQKPKAGSAKAKPKQSAAGPELPNGLTQSILIRRTLLTLNDANLTGNYTVLRDLAAPGFQSANDAARLGAIFAKLRNAKIDFAPIVYFDPKLVREPAILENGMLRLSGFIPTQPQQINFDMMFQNVSGRWRVFGLAVDTSPAAAAPDTSALGAAKAGKTAADGGAAKKVSPTTAKKK